MVYDLERAARALNDSLGTEQPITGLSPMTTGFSNDTYLVEGPDLILRLPPAAGAMLDGHDVITQARIYQALGAVADGPPVPRIVHLEEGDELLGAPFFVMTRVPGESVNDITMQAWFTDAADNVRQQMCQDWVTIFGQLARLAPLGVLGAPVSPEDDLQKWQRFAEQAKCARLVDLIGQLLKTPAPISGLPSIIQGDPKLSNLMWDDYRITALLDWEMSLNGEPLADLGYILYQFESEFHPAARAPKLPGMLKRNEVIELWEHVSGRPANGVIWHETAQMAKVTAIIAEGANMFNSGRSSDPKLVYFSKNLEHFLDVLSAMIKGSGF